MCLCSVLQQGSGTGTHSRTHHPRGKHMLLARVAAYSDTLLSRRRLVAGRKGLAAPTMYSVQHKYYVIVEITIAEGNTRHHYCRQPALHLHSCFPGSKPRYHRFEPATVSAVHFQYVLVVYVQLLPFVTRLPSYLICSDLSVLLLFQLYSKTSTFPSGFQRPILNSPAPVPSGVA